MKMTVFSLRSLCVARLLNGGDSLQQMMTNGVPMNGPAVTRPILPPQLEKKVVDVVDLVDDDDVTITTPTSMPNQVMVPGGQLRVIPASQLQQQQGGLTYAVVTSANTMASMAGPGVNRLLISRPPGPGQIVFSRNVNGMVARPPQVVICCSVGQRSNFQTD